jgi:lipopolysaccharide transport system ATP-binding protein
MDNDVLIKVQGVSKKFCRSFSRSIKYGIQDVARDLLGIDSKPGQLRKGEFWAVDDVSFELRRGQTLGIIGLNGSGKTTVLKMLNGIFMPDKGSVEVKGKVGALIAIGAGFHPMLSGRENIYVSGAILGMGKREIDKKFESIMEFADIGDFLDSPVKFYSDGMYVRLGFAIAVHCEPDILLVDEVLSVGDIKFQSKCTKFLTENVLKKGCSVVFVSHHRYMVQDLCQQVLCLKNGKMLQIGKTLDVIDRYLADIGNEEKKISLLPPPTQENEGVYKVLFTDKAGDIRNTFKSGEEARIRFYYFFREKVRNPCVAITLFHTDPRYNIVSSTDYVFNLHSGYDGLEISELKGKGYFEVSIGHLYIPVGIYTYSFYLYLENKVHLVKKLDNVGEIEILWPNNAPGRSLINLPHKWEIKEEQ